MKKTISILWGILSIIMLMNQPVQAYSNQVSLFSPETNNQLVFEKEVRFNQNDAYEIQTKLPKFTLNFINEFVEAYIQLQSQAFSHLEFEGNRLRNHQKPTLDIELEYNILSDDLVTLTFKNTYRNHGKQHDRYRHQYLVSLKNHSIKSVKQVLDYDQLDQVFYNQLQSKYPKALTRDAFQAKLKAGEINLVNDHVSFVIDQTSYFNKMRINIPYRFLLSGLKEPLKDYAIAKTPTKKRITFTFDDGPSIYTPQILDILAKYNIKATFFILGQRVNSHSTLIQRIYEEGHELANHSYGHPALDRLSDQQILSEVNRTNQAVYDLTGYQMRYLRPPYGSSNTRVDQLIPMEFVYWNIDPLDWKYRNKDSIVNQIRIQARNDGIILMHDLYQSSVDALEASILYLLSQGYEIVGLSEILD